MASVVGVLAESSVDVSAHLNGLGIIVAQGNKVFRVRIISDIEGHTSTIVVGICEQGYLVSAWIAGWYR
jgi:hypothetical protein